MSSEPIAIIGSGCRFPGECNSPSKLWSLLREPRDLQSVIPSSRFNPDGFYHQDNHHHGSANVRHAYLLSEDHRHFDAQFFSIKPAEANCIDPQQRLLLETVYESVEAAGLRLEHMQGSETAVYVGLMCADYADMIVKDPDNFPVYLSTGTARSIMANRISYFFDWHGPCMTIDTACSSSLIAVHQAVQTLRSGQSRTAIAAGSNLCLGPEPFIAESKLKMLSPTGRSRMWSANADGYARGDGVASVVLKTLSAALEDGDHIECIIRETGANQDGRTKGITMPSATAQAALIRATYQRAGLDLTDPKNMPQYFEAHGTGTPAGDPIEAEAISSVFFSAYEKEDEERAKRKLYVGSIKTIIGHTEGTAGLASLIKASLALQHQTIPPNMHFDELNPNIEPFYSNLEIPCAPVEWLRPEDGTPRRASVNSFGFGGTNSHAILEEYIPATTPIGSSIAAKANFLPLVLSATSEQTLMSTISSFTEYLDQCPPESLTDVAYTLTARRSRLPYRALLSGRDSASITSKLKDFMEKNDLSQVIHDQPKDSTEQHVLGIFTGQGAQWATMGRQLLLTSPAVQRNVNKMEQRLGRLPAHERPLWSLRGQLLAGPETSMIKQAALSQPLCTAIQVILVDALAAAGVHFDAVIGHSSGEIGAAYAAGLLTAEDAISIAYYRGLHSKAAKGTSGQSGCMMAVATTLEDATELCAEFEGRISIAAVNASTSVTLSGDADTVQQAKDILDEEKKFARILAVDKAYHSPHMLACSDSYLKSLSSLNIEIQTPSRPCKWYSSVRDAEMDVSSVEIRGQYWVDNMVMPVLFSQALECALAGIGRPTLAIEVGPHPALKGPAMQVVQELIEQPLQYCGTLKRGSDDVEALSETIANVWAFLDLPQDKVRKFASYMSGGVSDVKVKKGLPTYPWNHDRVYWHESRTSRITRTRKANGNELLGHRQPEDPENQFRWRNMISPREVPYLAGHKIQGQMIFPAAAYLAAAIEAAQQIASDDNIKLIELLDVVIGQAILFEDVNSTVETLFTVTNLQHVEGAILADFAFYSAAAKESATLILNTHGRFRIAFGSDDPHALPPRSSAGKEMIEVADDRFYNTLSNLGYGYERSFRALTKMQRKLGMVSGKVKSPLHEDASALTVHPATLDAAIQSIMLAKSWPGDGRLWTLHVPTGISRAVFIPHLLNAAAGANEDFHFDSTIANGPHSGILGDVAIFTEGEQYRAITMEGIHAIPLEAPSPSSDRPLFSSICWGPALPDAAVVAYDGKGTKEDYELAYILERVSHYYLRLLDDAFQTQDVARHEGPYAGLLNYASHVSRAVQSGSHTYAESRWVQDTESIIAHESARFSNNIDLRIMHIIGQNMAAVIRGETTILEHLRKDNLLDDYYVQAMGISYYTNYLARVLGQLTHRYPQMNILEIGAGTGGATKSIMQVADHHFLSYTFTDVSSGFFEKAQEVFHDHTNQMLFKVLDIEKDIVDQGFQDGSYDVIVASFVLHATRDLEKTMSNVRRLLKAGGILLLLEVTNLEQTRLGFIFGSLPGWWLGADDGRVLSPCVDVAAWDTILRKTGFSGVDSQTPDNDQLPFPASVIVSQASDPVAEFLRDPLYSPYDDIVPAPGISNLVIIGGATQRVARIVNHLHGMLRSHCVSISRVESLENLIASNIPINTTVLNLADLDAPIFKDLSAATFQGLKVMYKNATAVMWVTTECWENNPHHSQSMGFGRSMQVEMPHVRSQFLDLDRVGRSTGIELAESLLRFAILNYADFPAIADSMLWTTETEIAVRDDRHIIPRIKPNQEQNDRYNSSRRKITQNVDVATGVQVLIDGRNVHVKAYSPMKQAPETHLFQSLLSSVRSFGGQHLVLAIDARTGDKVLCLSTDHASTISVSEGTLVKASLNEHEWFFVKALAYLAASILLGGANHEDHICIVDPTPSVAAAVEYLMRSRGQQVTFVQTVPSTSTRAGWITVHRASTLRELSVLIPKTITAVLFAGEDAQVAARIAKSLPRIPLVRDLSAGDAMLEASPEDRLSRLEAAASYAGTEDGLTHSLSDVDFVTLAELQQSSVVRKITDLTILDWTKSSSAVIEVEPVFKKSLIRSDRTYWLVGLTGSLGISLCQWIIEQGGANVVFTSRNPKIDPEILADLEAGGAKVRVYAGDVTDRQSLRSVYSRILETLPPVSGIAQGAMVLRDTMISDMELDDMLAVMRPKVEGTRNLDELFSTDILDFFICFSSATCVTGNLGQSNYSVANMYMTGLTAQRRKRGLAGSAIDIGAILGVGYVTRETSLALQENLLKSGHIWMSEEDFHTLFAEAILAGRADSTTNSEISSGLATIDINSTQKPLWAFNPKFQHLLAGASDLEEGFGDSQKSVSLKTQLLEAQSMTEVQVALTDAFVRKISNMLQLDDSNDSETTLSLSAADHGIDSLNAVELRTWFMKEARVDMPVLRILGGATIRELIHFGLEALPVEVAPARDQNFKPDPNARRTTAGAAPAAMSKAPTKAKPVSISGKPKPKSVSEAPQSGASKPVSMPKLATREVDGSGSSPTPQQVTTENLSTLSSSTSTGIRGNASGSTTMSSSKPSSEGTDFEMIERSTSQERKQPEKASSTMTKLVKIAPMSFGQSRFWFLRTFLKDQTTFNITCALTFFGELRVADLEAAVYVVGQHHEALRTKFFQDETGAPKQGVLKNSTLKLEKTTYKDKASISKLIDELKRHEYDIENGEIMRIILASPGMTKTGEQQHELLIGYHHINMDGISLEILFSQLELAYKRQKITSKAIQYPDFAKRQESQRAQQVWKDDISFWKKELNGVGDDFPLLSLSELRVRQNLTSYQHRSVEFRVPSTLARKIKSVCAASKTTPYHFYLAVFHVMLMRSAATSDFCIGVADGNRHDHDTLEAIGLYLNLLPLRLQLDYSMKFTDALKIARTKAYAAMAHSRVPFNVLLDDLKVPRSASRNPIFQVFLDYRQSIDEARPFDDGRLQGHQYETSSTAYDIALDVVDNSRAEALLIMAVQKDIYSDHAANLLMSTFVHLVEQFSKDTTKNLNTPSLYSPLDVEKAIELGRGRTTTPKWPQTLIHRVDDMVKKFKNNTALTDGDQTLTYSQMSNRVSGIASSLTQARAEPGDRIAVFMTSSIDWLCSLLAVMRIGAVYIPLDSRVSLARLAVIAKDCSPKIILHDEATSRNVSSLGADSAKLVNIASIKSSSAAMANMARAESPAAILYTSGSTGEPKGIILKHSGLRNNIEGSTDVFQVKADDLLLQQIALSFDFSLWQIFISLSNGAGLYMAPDSARGDPIALSKIIASQGITITGATPSEYTAWLRFGEMVALQNSRWRMAVSGGEPLTEKLKVAFRSFNKSNLKLFNGFGPTEVTISSNKMEIPYNSSSSEVSTTSNIPVGFTVPNYSVYIVDDDLNAVPMGVAGQVVIGGAGVTAGYLHNESQTKERFVVDKYASKEFMAQGWTTAHLTGDRGRLSTDGALILEGRISGDTQIKLRGLRIDLQDVEATIIKAAGGLVFDCVVSLRQEFLVSHVVLSADCSDAAWSDFLKNSIRELPLPKYMVPSMFVTVDQLPMNQHSKLDRKAVAAFDLPKRSQEGLDVLAIDLSSTEQHLRSLWSQVIPSELFVANTINRESDFFQVGGNSLLLVKLQQLIKDKFEVELVLTDLFESSSLQSMASRIAGDVIDVDTVDDRVAVEKPSHEETSVSDAVAADRQSVVVPAIEKQSSTSRSKATDTTIDWAKETSISDIKPMPSTRMMALSLPKADGKVFILTGATGFLGRQIVQSLVSRANVAKVHCIAVRNSPSQMPSLSSLSPSKIVVHSGDLSLPRLGLSASIASAMFDEADALIHNGADVSFLKTYTTLRAANLHSTKELIRLAASRSDVPLPIHYISTASIANLSGLPSFGEVSTSSFQPPTDNSYGYISSKWASERVLEQAAQVFNLPVTIHRPSSITGDNAPALDLMHNLLMHSRTLKAVPISPVWHGYIDFISVETCASDIVSSAIHSRTDTDAVKYILHSGEVEVPIQGMKSYLEQEDGGSSWYRAMSLAKWCTKAEAVGLSGLLVAFLLKTDREGGSIVFPQLVKTPAEDGGKRRKGGWAFWK